MLRIKKYFKVWYLLTVASFSSSLMNRPSVVLFLTGKVLRFLFFLIFLILLVGKTKNLAGYTLAQVVLFFLTFNLVDSTAQLFLRGIYHFRPLLVSGNFDLVLLKPVNPLFRILAGNTDVLDLITLLPLVFYLGIFLITSAVTITALGLLFYFTFFLNALIVALSLHIIVAAFGILTLEVDNIIWIYRDLSGMGRIPVDVYQAPIRIFLTFVVPIGIMMTFPVKALLGLLSLPWIISVLAGSGLFLWISLKFWHYSLTKYSSASS